MIRATMLQEEWYGATHAGLSDQCVPHLIELRGALDVPSLDGALWDLHARHQALRVAFAPDGATMVEGGTRPPLWRLDLTSVPEVDQDAAVRAIVRQECQRPMLLTDPPLWRCALIDLAPGRRLLLTVWHHTVWDGMSGSVLRRDITRLYHGRVFDMPPRLAPMTWQLGDVAAAERSHRMPLEHAEFWRGQMSEPRARIDLDADESQGIVQWAAPIEPIGAELIGALSDAAGQVPMGSVIRALVLASVMHRCTSHGGLVVGHVHLNRPDRRSLDIIGLMSDHLPMRVEIDRAGTFASLAAHVESATRAAQAHVAPMGAIRRAVSRSWMRNCGIDLSVNHMPALVTRARSDEPTPAGVAFVAREATTRGTVTHLRRSFSGSARLGYQIRTAASGAAEGELWGHVPAFSRATIAGLAQAVRLAAVAIAADPGATLRETCGEGWQHG